jgi:hypothetical protein
MCIESNPLESKNLFKENYTSFMQTRLAKRLYDKYTPRPYYLEYKSLRATTLFASYCFNFFSMATACILVYFFVLKMVPWKWVAIVATIIFLGLLEITKRAVSKAVFHEWFAKSRLNISFAALAIALTGMSILSSYFGSKQLVATMTSPPAVIMTIDSTAQQLRDRIGELNNQIEAARNTKRRGMTTIASQRTIEALTQQASTLEVELLRRIQAKEEKEERTHNVHNAQTAESASIFALVTLLLELFFLLCAWYLEYYDFRSFTELQINAKSENVKSQLQANSKPQTVSSKSNGEIAKIKSQIATARYRLKKGIGKESTSKRNLERLTELLTESSG